MKYLPCLLAASCIGLAGCQQNAAPVSVTNAPIAPAKPPIAAGISDFRITYEKPIPPLPPPGMVRIVPQKMQSDAKTVRWKWTIVSDRNWSGSQSDLFSAELTGPYPLKSTAQAGGTNVAEYELTFTAGTSHEGKPLLIINDEIRMVGTEIVSEDLRAKISGGHAAGEGSVYVSGKQAIANKAVKPLLTEEQVLSLPLDKAVLEVRATKPDGTAYIQSFRLKMDK